MRIAMMYTWKVNQHDSNPIYVNYKLSYIQNRKYIKEENNCGFYKLGKLAGSKLSFGSPSQIDAG